MNLVGKILSGQFTYSIQKRTVMITEIYKNMIIKNIWKKGVSMKKFMIICLPILLFYGTLFEQGAGKALYFDNTFEYVKCTSSASLNPSHITLETWINPASVSGSVDRQFIDKRNNGGYTLRHPQRKITFLLRNSESLSIGDVLTANDWHHVAATYDGADMRIYHNGKLVAGPKNIGSISFSNIHYLSIGAIAWTDWASTYCFNGKMDEVRI